MLAENCGCLILPFHYENLLSIIKAFFFPNCQKRGDGEERVQAPVAVLTFPPNVLTVWLRDERSEPTALLPLCSLLCWLPRLFVGEEEEEEEEGADGGINRDERRRRGALLSASSSLLSPSRSRHLL